MMEFESTAMATNNDKVEWVRGLLRSIRFPGFQRDIVAARFVQDIEVDDRRVTVHFAPNTRNQAKIERMEKDIRDILDRTKYFKRVEIQRHRPFADVGVLSGGGQTLPQADMVAEGGMPDPDHMEPTMQRPDMAPQAGYDEDGPEPMDGPRSDVYEGELPVLQWQIDPHDPAAKSGTANLKIDDWEFRLWWQVHPEQLVYTSIQAMRDDWVEHGGTARSHPVGRSDAVNLVYDMNRKAVVAIYGTVQDFRPFVDAFYRGYALKN